MMVAQSLWSTWTTRNMHWVLAHTRQLLHVAGITYQPNRVVPYHGVEIKLQSTLGRHPGSYKLE